MEQHPVPQNVTTFQFRLIGDMTIKQFGYLAGGSILAYIFYKLPLPIFFSWPLALVFGLGGIGFAFVPIEERPMDVWVLSFLKNVYSPTQFVWQKTPVSQPTAQPHPHSHPEPPLQKGVPSPAKSVADVLGGVFATTKAAPAVPAAAAAPRADQRIISAQPKQNPLDWIVGLFATPKRPPVTVRVPSVPTPSITGTRMDLSPPPAVTKEAAAKAAIDEVKQKESALEGKAAELKHELENKSMTEARILELQKQLTEVLAQKDNMEKEVIALRARVSAPLQQPTPVPAAPAPSGQAHVAMPPSPARPAGPTVKIITPEGAVKAGLPRLTTFPNVVTGIIKDSDNNLLPGVLVTVKDKDGVPLRALKTNRLGQFAASTPLANGVYFVEIEDPRGRFVFDRVQITLNGSIVPALEIIAKSQKQISRERLAREIFGNT